MYIYNVFHHLQPEITTKNIIFTRYVSLTTLSELMNESVSYTLIDGMHSGSAFALFTHISCFQPIPP